MQQILKQKRKGSVLLYSVVLMMVLVITAGAFMKWAADEAYQANYDLARTQAYYIAQQGAIEQGLGFLRSKKIYELDAADTHLDDGRMMQYGQYEGRYEDTHVLQQATLYNMDQNSGDFVKSGAWDATAVGRVTVTKPNGEVVDVSRRYTLRSQLRTFANYMYLSDIETAQPPDSSGDDVIWFYTGDTLYGRVHSNDYIGIKQSPVFYGPVSTSKDEFRENAPNPYFEFPPKYEVPEVYFPETADDIRAGASNGGVFLTDQNGTVRTQIEGNADGWYYVQWDAGSGVQPTPPYFQSGIQPYGVNNLIFVDGDLFIKGESIRLKSTICSAGNMYLIDNVKYADVGYNAIEIPEGSQNILGLVSEKNIVIRNSFPNGKHNGGNSNPNAPHNQAHIIITAGMVALGESFTFENQNDYITTPEGRIAQPAPWDLGNVLWCITGNEGQDMRGYIYVRGAIAQKRRGYVARSNCGRTGYDKSYDYDFRLQTDPPPLYLAAQDEDGNVFFEVTSSWDDKVD